MSESFYMRPQSYGYSIVWKRSVIRLKLSIWMNYTRVRNVWFTSLLTIRTNYKRFTSPFPPRALPLSLYHCHLLLCLDECDCFKFIASSEAYYMCQRIYCMIRFGYVNGWREEKKGRFRCTKLLEYIKRLSCDAVSGACYHPFDERKKNRHK